MARPRGEIRQALAGAAERLLVDGGWVCDGVAMNGVTWRQMAAAALVGWDAGRRTVVNMVYAGELVQVGRIRPPGGERWQTLYAPRHLVDRQQVVGQTDDDDPEDDDPLRPGDLVPAPPTPFSALLATTA